MARKNQSNDISGWVGWVYFAGIMMFIVGILQAIEGLVALFKDSVFLVGPHNVWVFDTTAWGWIHLIIGVIVLLAGLAVLNGRMWGRVVGIVLSVLAIIANFAFIPVYPIWSIVMIVISILVLYALVTHGAEAKDALSD